MQSHRKSHLTRDEIERRRTRSTAVRVAQQKAGDVERADQEFDFGASAPNPAAGAPVEVPAAQTYVCADCQADIAQGDAACAGCGVKLDWEGI